MSCSDAKCHTANLARPYHTRPDVSSRSPTSLRPDVKKGSCQRKVGRVAYPCAECNGQGAQSRSHHNLEIVSDPCMALFQTRVHPNDRASASHRPTTGLDRSSSIRRNETFGRSPGAGSRIICTRMSQFTESASDVGGGVLSKLWSLLYTMFEDEECSYSL